MRSLQSIVIGAGLLLAMSASAVANDGPLHGYFTAIPPTRSVDAPASLSRSVKPLPTWTYTVKAGSDLGGGTFHGQIIGRDPNLAVKGSTFIKTQIVPLVVTISDKTGTQVYDPTKPDPCNTNHAAVTVVEQSPIFTLDNTWVVNGVNVGKTQYIDAFQRAEFWSLVSGSKYHLILKPSVLPAQPLSFTGTAGVNFNAGAQGGCGFIGVVNLGDLDARIQALITGPLATMVNAGTFPIFITKDVVESEANPPSPNKECCVLGYHSGLTVGRNLQIYSPFAFDASGEFGGDVNTLAHEMGEAINDPSTGNPTPVWGNIGQVLGRCQSNFEVGDPLSAGFGTPTNPWIVKGKNGLTYHLQELAFLSWYYGGTSLGAGGGFSNHGTFGGDAILCSLGGGTH